MEWHDEEGTTHPWETGGDLPWATPEPETGWLPADPDAWRGTTHLEMPAWPDLTGETWPSAEADDEE